MRISTRPSVATIVAVLLLSNPMSRVSADGSKDKPKSNKSTTAAADQPAGAKADDVIPNVDLLDAHRHGLVSVAAEGRGDGRMTISVTNRTRRPLRVVLPPGIIAQGATGQFGGMGGMGGGMGGMGGGMGGMMGGMGGGMGGMGGGMGGRGMMGGMGGMGRMSGTMPSMMGMMMLSRMIMYFCGDPDSWDKRSLMIGMMGGMGMGGGMMGGMGGGMRSVPPTELPSAQLDPGQTRHLPTRLVSISPPEPGGEVRVPEQGEPLQLRDIADINNNPQVQKALRRLAADSVSKPIARLVMWRVAAGLDWDTLAQMSSGWANRHELTLARAFVEHLDALPEGETGQVLFEVEGTDAASEALATQVKNAIRQKMVLGLLAEVGIPARPEGPAVACRVKMSASEALVQVTSSDATARSWVPFGKFTLPVVPEQGKFDPLRFADGLSEGLLNRLVRAQLDKGLKDKGKMHYQIRIDNASPLVLNGLAALGIASKPDETPKVLAGICVSPRRSMTVPASEEVVKALGLKKGIKLVALDLSGL